MGASNYPFLPFLIFQKAEVR